MDVYSVTWSNAATVAAGNRTMVQIITGAALRAQIVELKLAFDGVSSTAEPVDVQIMTQTTAGTAGAATPRARDTAAPAATTTAQTGFSSTEPTTGVVLDQFMLHPQGGLYAQAWALGDPLAFMANVSTRLAIVIICPTGVSPNCSGSISFCE